MNTSRYPSHLLLLAANMHAGAGLYTINSLLRNHANPFTSSINDNILQTVGSDTINHSNIGHSIFLDPQAMNPLTYGVDWLHNKYDSNGCNVIEDNIDDRLPEGDSVHSPQPYSIVECSFYENLIRIWSIQKT